MPDEQFDHGPGIPLLIKSVDDELKSILRGYAGLMPPTLIMMGKRALSGPGKVFSWSPERAGSGSPPKWPLVVLLSCQAVSEPGDREAWRKALPAAVAVEIAMAAADLLDELADDDPSFLASEYGTGQALNTGNLMLVMAQQALLNSAKGDGRQHALRALGALQNMLVQAAVGQHLDMLYERMGPDEVTLEMSARMTELKAGALVSGACRMGVLMSGAGDDLVELATSFGKEIGSIAQLINDLQDVLPQNITPGGDPIERSDWPAPKTDLRRRKRTLPIVFALRDDYPQPNAVQRAFSGDSSEDDEALRRAVVDAGGVEFVKLIVEVHTQKALEVLEALEALRPGARAILKPLIP